MRCTWGEDRVYYYDDQQQLKSILLAWTSLRPLDPFVSLAAGRAPFRTVDLLTLISLLQNMNSD